MENTLLRNVQKDIIVRKHQQQKKEMVHAFLAIIVRLEAPIHWRFQWEHMLMKVRLYQFYVFQEPTLQTQVHLVANFVPQEVHALGMEHISLKLVIEEHTGVLQIRSLANTVLKVHSYHTVERQMSHSACLARRD